MFSVPSDGRILSSSRVVQLRKESITAKLYVGPAFWLGCWVPISYLGKKISEGPMEGAI